MLKNKKTNLFKMLLLMMLLSGGAGAIYVAMAAAPSNQLSNSSNQPTSNNKFVIRAGEPTKTNHRGGVKSWNLKDLNDEEKEIKKLKEKSAKSNAAVQSSTITAMTTALTTAIANAITTATPKATAAALPADAKVLVLYDYVPDQPYGQLGKAYALMLRNLLGHFYPGDNNVVMMPVDNYVTDLPVPAGGTRLDNFDATFYLGAYFRDLLPADSAVDVPLPAQFLADIKVTQKTVVWFKNNLHQLSLWGAPWSGGGDFASHFGFQFNGIQSYPASGGGFFDTVVYKGKSFVKFFTTTAGGAINADPDAGQTTITNPALAQAFVPIRNSTSGVQMPYIVKSNNFWYVADTPFTYIGPRDRYLVMADVLHDIFHIDSTNTIYNGIDHSEKHIAMARFEDMSYLTDFGTFKTLVDYMNSVNATVNKPKIPFSMGIIPHYLDPAGAYNNGIPQNIPLAQACNLKKAINYGLQNNAGAVIQHGFTHQYNEPNPWNGVSGNDFEFWRVTLLADGATRDLNEPIEEDLLSDTWSPARVNQGKTELMTPSAAVVNKRGVVTCPASPGYAPYAWEIPHYQGSEHSYRTTAVIYPKAYERAVYYTAPVPNLDPLDPLRDVDAGQFFPYEIKKDFYGRRILPENLGNIEYNICNLDPASCASYGWNELLTNADYGLVVRDGFASFFFHPFWLENFQGYNFNALADFKSLINGINNLSITNNGTTYKYNWIRADQL